MLFSYHQSCKLTSAIFNLIQKKRIQQKKNGHRLGRTSVYLSIQPLHEISSPYEGKRQFGLTSIAKQNT